MNVNVDMITTNAGGINGSSDVAGRLLKNNMSVHALRPWIGQDGRAYMSINVGGKLETIVANSATLRRLEWEQYDQVIIKEALVRLVGVADLQSRGLVYNIGNGLGKTVLTSENLNTFLEAELSMDGLSKTRNDRAVYGVDYLPLPLIHCDYFINARNLAESRNTGDSLDTTNAQMAARAVAEKMEEMLFTGTSSYAYGGGTIYGYLDFPYVNNVTLDANWDASGVTGADILADVLEMKATLIADRFYGPFVVYVPTAYEVALDNDFKANSDLTVRQRLLQVASISDIKVVDKLTANHVVMVQMTSDVVRLVNGMEISPVEWQEQGGMVLHYKVMGIKVPQIRATQGQRCGICVLHA
jgi:uncharacterized linocin/CFP29 family protein